MFISTMDFYHIYIYVCDWGSHQQQRISPDFAQLAFPSDQQKSHAVRQDLQDKLKSFGRNGSNVSASTHAAADRGCMAPSMLNPSTSHLWLTRTKKQLMQSDVGPSTRQEHVETSTSGNEIGQWLGSLVVSHSQQKNNCHSSSGTFTLPTEKYFSFFKLFLQVVPLSGSTSFAFCWCPLLEYLGLSYRQ